MLIEDRAKKKKAKWEIYKTNSLVDAVHKARDLGWGRNEVQVKGYQMGVSLHGDLMEYVIEPYEKDCGCSSLMHYSDFFLPENAPIESGVDG